MNTQEARSVGIEVSSLVRAGQLEQASARLAPILAGRTRFALLDRIGGAIGDGPLEPVNAFLDQVAAGRAEGGWVIVASALGRQLNRDMAGAFARCQTFVRLADIWYGTDILGERVPGPALVADMESALTLLAPWRGDPDRWVRRTAGVAAHFWAKRSRGEYPAQAEALLAFLGPMFEERNVDAIKGVGWGLKTLGRYYPDLVANWLAGQLAQDHRCRALMLRKALTYLPAEQRARVLGGA